MTSYNIALKLKEKSQLFPNKTAVKFAPSKHQHKFDYKKLSFKELEQKANNIAHGLLEMGFKKGDKTLVFIRPSLNFSALTFALFKAGIMPIFIDPGMGRKNLLRAITHIQPDGLIAEQEVHIARLLFPRPFKSVKHFVTNGSFAWGQMKKLKDLANQNTEQIILEEMNEDDEAAILFTSGGTGIPKGVLYTHGIFTEQTRMLQEIFSLTENDIDVPGFPLFSLFTIAMGMTSAIPNMDPSKPSQCNPEFLVENIQDNKATFIAGSPAIWERVADYCLKKNITLPSVKYLVMFGAPVRVELHEKFSKILTNGDTFTPYGATECLPVANTSGSTILGNHQEQMLAGKGTFLGKAVPGARVEIIPITEEPMVNITENSFVAPNTIGEIIVQSRTVTPEYVGMPEKTAEAKSFDEMGKRWHRMGDIGFKDDQGNIWFGGRKGHRVEKDNELLSSVQCEAIFNRHPMVSRSALIKIEENGQVQPAIVIEAKGNKIPSIGQRQHLQSELIKMAGEYGHTKLIHKVYFRKKFPVDVRHNIKIDRTLLSREAQQGLLR